MFFSTLKKHLFLFLPALLDEANKSEHFIREAFR